jgi:general secretion pathway protein E
MTSPSLKSAAQALGLRLYALDDLLQASLVANHAAQVAEARREVLPILADNGDPVFVIGDPTDTRLIEWLYATFPRPVTLGLADKADIAQALARRHGTAPVPRPGSGPQQRAAAGDSDSRSPVVSFVQRVVEDAWRAGASDIHFETRRTGIEIKFRLDGVLVSAGTGTADTPPEEILSRLKVLAGLDIAERKIPQDGRLSFNVDRRAVDVRVSIMPNAFGEDAVLRLLDKRQLVGEGGRMSLDSLGFADQQLATLRALARRPHGMLLVTGPTGSGKTTTLYAAISETLSGQEKVITIEDPIEYELPGVLQIPVNEKKGLTFSRGLRSILRHDPDTIFVGEIRDAETADIAVQAALTGHLVFTTVHANNIFDVLGRFVHMGVDPFSFMSALNGVVSQRLLRRLCPACKQPDAETSSGTNGEHEHRIVLPAGALPMRSVGCDACRHTGYLGRMVVSETVIVDDRFREMVVARAPIGELKACAKRLSSASMREVAVALVAEGKTSIEEVSRVLAFD